MVRSVASETCRLQILPSHRLLARTIRVSSARISSIVLATLALGALALAYPLFARGAEWLDARWQYPWVLAALVVVPVLLARGTVGQDARMPRVRVGTLRAPQTPQWRCRRCQWLKARA